MDKVYNFIVRIFFLRKVFIVNEMYSFIVRVLFSAKGFHHGRSVTNDLTLVRKCEHIYFIYLIQLS